MTAVSPPSRILLVALDNLGDLVFASALSTPLHTAFPGATIDVWCKAYTASVARLIPHVRKVIAADPPWAIPAHLDRPALGPFLRSLAAVRRERYDVALLTGSPWRTAAAVAAAGIPVRIGLARRHNHYFLTHTLPSEDPHKAVVREQARLLAPLAVLSANPHYQLASEPLGELAAVLSRRLPTRFIALHPFASARDRCVPLDEWRRLAGMIASRGIQVLWIGMGRELADLRQAAVDAPGLFIDQLADASLDATAAALSLASMLVGHDSGPMHVAAAFGVPVVGVFAPGQPDRTFPQGVGPWRMIHRPTPAGISAETMLREVDDLDVFSTA